MNQSDGQINLAAFYNVFKVSLNRDQQVALQSLLPKNATRSLDDESLQTNKPKKKQQNPIVKDEKDPDYSAPYIPRAPKDPPTQKVQSSPGIPGGQQFMECYLILKKLKKSIYSWPFKVPVDPKALKIPQYINVVQEPMDLKTMQDNIKKEGYQHPGQFHRDIYKMLMNSYKFNQKNSEVFQTTIEFEEEYLKVAKDAREGKLKQLEKKSVTQEDAAMSQQMMPDNYTSMEIEKTGQHIKKTRHKKDKSDKQVQIKAMESQPIIKEELPEKIQAQVFDDSFKAREEKIKNECIDPFFSFNNEEQVREEPSIIKIEKQPEPEVKKGKCPREPKLEQNKESNDDPEFSLEPEKIKKTKSKLMNQDKKVKEKKVKESKKAQQPFESPNQMKEFRQTTQAENEKTVLYNQIGKNLTNLLKKFSQYQIPSKKVSKQSKSTNYEHPNFNNFTTITATQKKKLAQKIHTLPECDLRYVIQICYRNRRLKSRDDEGVYQIDLEKLDGKVLKELSNFVSMRVKKMKRDVVKQKEEQKHQERVVNEQEEAEMDEEEVEMEVEEEDPRANAYEQQEMDNLEDNYRSLSNSNSYSNLLDSEERKHTFNRDYNAQNFVSDVMAIIESGSDHNDQNSDDIFD